MMDLTTPNAKSAANPNNTTQQHTTKDDLLSNVTQWYTFQFVAGVKENTSDIKSI